MYSWAAIWALVRPWATRVTSSRSRALSCPGLAPRPAAAGRRGGEHEAYSAARPGHRRAAGLAPGLPAARLAQGFRVNPSGWKSAACPAQGRDGFGVTPGHGAQVPTAVQAVLQLRLASRSASRSGAFPQVRGRIGESGRPFRSRITIRSSSVPLIPRSPRPGDRASPAAHTRSAAASSPTSISTSSRRHYTPGSRAGRGLGLFRLPGQLYCASRSPTTQATAHRIARASASASG